jgi:transcriptional regulator with XRE-family HTH domain
MDALAKATAPNYAPAAVAEEQRPPGPWGDAIRYWLGHRNMPQAELVRRTRLGKGTIRRARQGGGTTTRVLWKIADALNVTIAEVLISPLHRFTEEERQRLAKAIAEHLSEQKVNLSSEVWGPHLTRAVKELQEATVLEEAKRQQRQRKPLSRRRMRRHK